MYLKNVGPPTHGANEDVPVREEETYRGFERLIKLRGEQEYQRRIRRMRALGLL